VLAVPTVNEVKPLNMPEVSTSPVIAGNPVAIIAP
jgi:hypothetical protein